MLNNNLFLVRKCSPRSCNRYSITKFTRFGNFNPTISCRSSATKKAVTKYDNLVTVLTVTVFGFFCKFSKKKNTAKNTTKCKYSRTVTLF